MRPVVVALLLAASLLAVGAVVGKGKPPCKPRDCPTPTPSPTLTPTPTPSPTPTPTPPPSTGCTVTLSSGASVQAAIDAAAAGSTICLGDGNYTGFIVTKALTIRGGHIHEDRSRVVEVMASGVTLDGIEVSGANLYEFGSGVRFLNVSSGTIKNCFLHDNEAQNLDLTRANNMIVTNCEISRSGVGIWVYQSTGYDIFENDIHDIIFATRNDTAPDNDYGGQCIVLTNSLGEGLIRANLIHTCHTDSIDYGPNGMGVGIEIYQSGGFVARRNKIWDVTNGFESGTHGPELPFTFQYNEVYDSIGPLLILRSNPGSVIQHNTFDGNADGFLLAHHAASQYSTGIDNVIIRDNLFTNNPVRAYRMDTDMPASLVIDHNGYWNNGRIEWDWGTFAQWQAGTPYDDHGVNADPLYVDAGTHDYRLQPGSPMIGAGHDGSNIGAR